MDEVEAKVRCLELAAVLNARSGLHFPQAVADTARILYDFVNAPPEASHPPEHVDKSKPGRKPKVGDLLS